jgi:hypothetical protein
MSRTYISSSSWQNVHGVSRSDHVLARLQHVGNTALATGLHLVDTKDCADIDTGVNVGRTVERVKHHATVISPIH